MRETTLEAFKKGGHEWTITRRTWEPGAAPYVVYRDGEFWSSEDSYRDAMDEIKEAIK